MGDKLGEMLLSQKIVTEAQMKDALEKQQQIGGRLGMILTRLRYVTEDQLANFLGQQLKIPVMHLKDLVVEPNVSALVDVEVLQKHQVLPIRRTGDALLVAAVEPQNLDGMDELQFLTGLRVEAAVVSRANITKAIDYYFHGKPCPELLASEKHKTEAVAESAAVKDGTRATPTVLLQALTELLIEKRIVTRAELLEKLADKGR